MTEDQGSAIIKHYKKQLIYRQNDDVSPLDSQANKEEKKTEDLNFNFINNGVYEFNSDTDLNQNSSKSKNMNNQKVKENCRDNYTRKEKKVRKKRKNKNCRGQFRHEAMLLIKLGTNNSTTLCKNKTNAISNTSEKPTQEPSNNYHKIKTNKSDEYTAFDESTIRENSNSSNNEDNVSLSSCHGHHPLPQMVPERRNSKELTKIQVESFKPQQNFHTNQQTHPRSMPAIEPHKSLPELEPYKSPPQTQIVTRSHMREPYKNQESSTSRPQATNSKTLSDDSNKSRPQLSHSNLNHGSCKSLAQVSNSKCSEGPYKPVPQVTDSKFSEETYRRVSQVGNFKLSEGVYKSMPQVENSKLVEEAYTTATQATNSKLRQGIYKPFPQMSNFGVDQGIYKSPAQVPTLKLNESIYKPQSLNSKLNAAAYKTVHQLSSSILSEGTYKQLSQKSNSQTKLGETSKNVEIPVSRHNLNDTYKLPPPSILSDNKCVSETCRVPNLPQIQISYTSLNENYTAPPPRISPNSQNLPPQKTNPLKPQSNCNNNNYSNAYDLKKSESNVNSSNNSYVTTKLVSKFPPPYPLQYYSPMNPYPASSNLYNLLKNKDFAHPYFPKESKNSPKFYSPSPHKSPMTSPNQVKASPPHFIFPLSPQTTKPSSASYVNSHSSKITTPPYPTTHPRHPVVLPLDLQNHYPSKVMSPQTYNTNQHQHNPLKKISPPPSFTTNQNHSQNTSHYSSTEIKKKSSKDISRQQNQQHYSSNGVTVPSPLTTNQNQSQISSQCLSKKLPQTYSYKNNQTQHQNYSICPTKILSPPHSYNTNQNKPQDSGQYLFKRVSPPISHTTNQPQNFNHYPSKEVAPTSQNYSSKRISPPTNQRITPPPSYNSPNQPQNLTIPPKSLTNITTNKRKIQQPAPPYHPPPATENLKSPPPPQPRTLPPPLPQDYLKKRGEKRKLAPDCQGDNICQSKIAVAAIDLTMEQNKAMKENEHHKCTCQCGKIYSHPVETVQEVIIKVPAEYQHSSQVPIIKAKMVNGVLEYENPEPKPVVGDSSRSVGVDESRRNGKVPNYVREDVVGEKQKQNPVAVVKENRSTVNSKSSQMFYIKNIITKNIEESPENDLQERNKDPIIRSRLISPPSKIISPIEVITRNPGVIVTNHNHINSNKPSNNNNNNKLKVDDSPVRKLASPVQNDIRRDSVEIDTISISSSSSTDSQSLKSPSRPSSAANVDKPMPQGKLFYLKNNNTLIRYFDDKQKQLFIENMSADEGDLLMKRVAEFDNNEIIPLPRNVVFNEQDSLSVEDYVLEIILVEKFIPRDFFLFYKFVTGYQICHNNLPVSFVTFLKLFNTNGLHSLLEKYKNK